MWLSKDGDVITFGDVSVTVIRLTGHTPGSVALLYDNPGDDRHVFTGDSLFPGGVGNTFGDATAFRTLYADVVANIVHRQSAVRRQSWW